MGRAYPDCCTPNTCMLRKCHWKHRHTVPRLAHHQLVNLTCTYNFSIISLHTHHADTNFRLTAAFQPSPRNVSKAVCVKIPSVRNFDSARLVLFNYNQTMTYLYSWNWHFISSAELSFSVADCSACCTREKIQSTDNVSWRGTISRSFCLWSWYQH